MRWVISLARLVNALQIKRAESSKNALNFCASFFFGRVFGLMTQLENSSLTWCVLGSVIAPRDGECIERVSLRRLGQTVAQATAPFPQILRFVGC